MPGKVLPSEATQVYAEMAEMEDRKARGRSDVATSVRRLRNRSNPRNFPAAFLVVKIGIAAARRRPYQAGARVYISALAWFVRRKRCVIWQDSFAFLG